MISGGAPEFRASVSLCANATTSMAVARNSKPTVRNVFGIRRGSPRPSSESLQYFA
jgi:hypothetical protein